MSSGKRKYGGSSSGSSAKRARPSAPNMSGPRSVIPRRPSQRAYPSRPKFGEIKGVDQSVALSPVIATTGTNGSIFTMNLVAPGSGSYNRVGRKIICRSLRLKMTVEAAITQVAATGDLLNNWLRYIVVWDKQPQGVLPAFDTIFGYTAQDGTETSLTNAPLKYDGMDRFKVLLDKVCDLNAMAGMPANGDVYTLKKFVDEYIKLPNLETVFSAQTTPASIADIASGGLYLIFRTDVNTAASSVVSIGTNSIARLRYTD